MIKEGIINIYKPMGMTSHDCIYVMRRLTGIKRIGHTGTLDPNATGVLPTCIGTAARVTEYMDMDYKTYLCSMNLGMETDTQDIWGKVLSDKRAEILENPFSENEIRSAFSEFCGVISQYPPKYSAVRIAGRRLYEYARDGAEVEIKPRTVYIKSLDIKKIDTKEQSITFEVCCSKGTYIRSICHDVGYTLGCGGVLTSLERTESGAFKADEAVDLEYLRALSNIAGPIRKYLDDEKKANTTLKVAEKINKEDDIIGNNQGKIAEALIKLKTFLPKADGSGQAGAIEIYKAVSEERPSGEILNLIEDEINAYVMPVDVGMMAFGKAVIKTEERSRWFVNGGHISFKEVEVLSKPMYEKQDFPLEIREDYKRAYCLYAPAKKGDIPEKSDNNSDVLAASEFLGVAFYSEKYKKLVADKVFTRY